VPRNVEEQSERLDTDLARYCSPADQWRHRTRGAANHNVLRCAPFEPDSIDEHIEEIGKRQKGGGDCINSNTHYYYRGDTYCEAEHQCIFRRYASRRNGSVSSPLHQRINVAIIPHIDRPRTSGGGGNTQHGQCRCQRMQLARSYNQTGKACKHHQRHDTRL